MKECVVCHVPINGQKIKYCSGACKQKDHYNKVKLQNNTYHHQTIRGLTRKIFFINFLGGKCEICGYDKNISVFNFHHNNPDEKEFQLDIRTMSNRSFESLEKEVSKCSLLCSNCHSELHHPELGIDNVNELLESQLVKKKLKTPRKTKNYCNCGQEILFTSKKCVNCESNSRINLNKPDIEQLKNEISKNTYAVVAKKYNVSRTTIKRWLNLL